MARGRKPPRKGGTSRQVAKPAVPGIFTADINRNYLADEPELVRSLCALAQCPSGLAAKIEESARRLVEAVRAQRDETTGLDAFLSHYDLTSQEGVALMCLAESLLRIPDVGTADRLIADKLGSADWRRHLGRSESLFVNASTWALMLTGSVIRLGEAARDHPADYMQRLLARMEEPVLRAALKSAMRIMASQFVMGRSISEALDRTHGGDFHGSRFSFDMLGESVVTTADAERYEEAYLSAVAAIGARVADGASLPARPGISVKLSALCARFDYRHSERALRELAGRLRRVALAARNAGIGLTVDAEEADRLEIMLAVFESVYCHPDLAGWTSFGVAVQAYQKRALPVLRWLEALAVHYRRDIPVRLVKGAYWDTEIKHAQESGVKDYPVFTRKCNTDVSYLACARVLLGECNHLYPQFATHNAQTIAWVVHHAGSREFEFQRLHGMGMELYRAARRNGLLAAPCRVYAPVGAHEDLLPYLVRRLLENGANTSFVNQIAREDIPVARIVADPLRTIDGLDGAIRNPRIPVPPDLFAPGRRNSAGINLSDRGESAALLQSARAAALKIRHAAPMIGGEPRGGVAKDVFDPAQSGRRIGTVCFASPEEIRDAIDVADRAWPGWNRMPASARAAILERAADLFEGRRAELVSLCAREAGRTVPDAIAEVRETVDFLRYYAVQARALFSTPLALPGPTGESNELFLSGRGLFLCISPWNFPIAIFVGQIAAALAAGNSVLAKPAEQTSLTGQLAVSLLYAAGIPTAVLNFLPGDGPGVGRIALADARIAGVAFTGSTDTAQGIHRALAARDGPIAALIAETGGQNALIADSSALPEQLVLDAAYSAFNSAGQRCSSLRLLYLQEDIAERVIRLLKGHMDELVTGDPLELATDIGPVIDREARDAIETHIGAMAAQGRLLHRCAPGAHTDAGWFVPPALIELERIGQLRGEVFGPVLHVVRYPAKYLDRVIEEINGCGYGLTLGIHSRIEATAEYVRSRVRVGNVYVNRNLIGAVVGVQPFGGLGLSGTGPKTGGPHYLQRFATEQTLTVNTAAVGGNATLLADDS
ncbi:MAG: bifunctional proline dehydrogenase/L-glutamate gamma-semialdehyde dehydrogenase PutA [Gammaproteobacteria bacterium]|nr:bifunctional proline dehydrogenase/L-glutamate gamma-semialdehyde dehydrogenase PutA [Gammaproteobacteria bacterium]